jgi:hypothetical protein
MLNLRPITPYDVVVWTGVFVFVVTAVAAVTDLFIAPSLGFHIIDPEYKGDIVKVLILEVAAAGAAAFAQSMRTSHQKEQPTKTPRKLESLPKTKPRSEGTGAATPNGEAAPDDGPMPAAVQPPQAGRRKTGVVSSVIAVISLILSIAGVAYTLPKVNITIWSRPEIRTDQVAWQNCNASVDGRLVGSGDIKIPSNCTEATLRVVEVGRDANITVSSDLTAKAAKGAMGRTVPPPVKLALQA